MTTTKQSSVSVEEQKSDPLNDVLDEVGATKQVPVVLQINTNNLSRQASSSSQEPMSAGSLGKSMSAVNKS